MSRYIYIITNLVNQKVYVGKHKWEGEDLDPYYFCSSYNHHFWNAIRKYEGVGSDKDDKDLKIYCDFHHKQFKSFKVEMIQHCYSEDSLNIMERMWIRYYRRILGKENVYNLHDGGDGGWEYVNELLEETPDLKSESAKKAVESRRKSGYFDTDEFKEIMKLGNSPESRRKSEATKRSNGYYESDTCKGAIRKLVDKCKSNGYYESDRFLEGIRKGVQVKRDNGYYESEEFLEARKKSGSKIFKKYKWKLPDGSIRLMDRPNGRRHKDWIILGPAD